MTYKQGTALIDATRRAAAAFLVGGIIAASGRPHSMAEAREMVVDAYHTLFPDAQSADYLDCQRKGRTEKVRT